VLALPNGDVIFNGNGFVRAYRHADGR